MDVGNGRIDILKFLLRPRFPHPVHLFLCLAALSSCSRAQSTLDSTPMATTPEPSDSSLKVTAASSLQTLSASLVQSSTTLSTINIFSNSTTTSNAQPTNQPPPDLVPASHPDNTVTRKEIVFNYYFLFLALFGVLVAALLWWLHRRRKQQKQLARQGGQEALARDLEGWTGTRHFFHGRYARNQDAAFIRRAEGLDEHGHAPPPYRPKRDMVMIQEPPEAARIAADRVSVPLRTHTGDQAESLPPGYYDIRPT